MPSPRDRIAEALRECHEALAQVAPPYSERMHRIVDEAKESARAALSALDTPRQDGTDSGLEARSADPGDCVPSPDVAADAVYGASCDVCGETMELSVTERDSRGTPTMVSTEGAADWTFNTDDGWRCPAHSESAAPPETEPQAEAHKQEQFLGRHAERMRRVDDAIEEVKDVSGEGER